MIHVLLTSELPWQRNDAIIFFTCLSISWYQGRYQEIFSRNRLRERVPPLVASIMANLTNSMRGFFKFDTHVYNFSKKLICIQKHPRLLSEESSEI